MKLVDAKKKLFRAFWALAKLVCSFRDAALEMGNGKVKKKIFECDRLEGGGINPFDSQKAYFLDFTEETRCAETKRVIHFEI